jgi:hypothetical protein
VIEDSEILVEGFEDESVSENLELYQSVLLK